jgi:deoxyribonuclease V
VKLPRPLHSWSLTPKRAIALQKQLARCVSATPREESPRLVAGLDAAFSPDGRFCIAAAVVWDLDEQRVVEFRIHRHRLRFPYIPGLLSFREAPAILGAIRKLQVAPELLICDGQGIAHPRRFGIASHLGLWLGLPSVGCAKSRLIGTHAEPGKQRGARTELRDREEIIGSVLRTQTGLKPLYVSVGHRIDLGTAEEIVLRTATRHRLPEPTHLADRQVAAVRKEEVRTLSRRSAAS